MGKTFQKIHGCAVGSFSGNGDKIPQWIRANGGTYSKEINTNVTHLITTREMYKANADAVKAAKLQGHVKIVTYDWLEDSLLSKNRRPKREKPYLLETILEDELKKEKAGKKGTKGKQDDGSKSKKRKRDDTDGNGRVVKSKSPNYHPYVEKETGLKYSATLVRPTTVPNWREKYQIEIYESNKEPRVYATYLKYSRVGTSSIQLLAPLGSELDLALEALKNFFKLKTGIKWAERFEDRSPPPKEDSEGQILPAHEGWFHEEKQMTLLGSFMRQGPLEVVEKAEVEDKGSASQLTSVEVDELRVEEDTVMSNDPEWSVAERKINTGTTGVVVEVPMTSEVEP